MTEHRIIEFGSLEATNEWLAKQDVNIRYVQKVGMEGYVVWYEGDATVTAEPPGKVSAYFPKDHKLIKGRYKTIKQVRRDKSKKKKK